jgi:hypothetical protein
MQRHYINTRMKTLRVLFFAIVPLFSLFFVSCPAETWISLTSHQQPAVTRSHVQFLDSPPTRPHEVIGIITPPAGQYETEAEAVKEMRAQAAKYGADAIYIESQSESGSWRFGSGFGGVSGGSFSELRFRAKAIVWK